MVKSLPFSYSLELRRSENEAENFRLAMDAEARAKAYQRSIDTAVSRICEARRSGANLFHSILDTKDFGSPFFSMHQILSTSGLKVTLNLNRRRSFNVGSVWLKESS